MTCGECTMFFLQQVEDFRKQSFSRCRCRGCYGLSLFLFFHSVDALNGDKQNESDDQEVQRGGNEIAVRQNRSRLLRVNQWQPGFNRGAEWYVVIRKIKA